ncbi:hypothetical protein BO86DRAFT_80109 [Aspergillus japonicus CBS 114.51]|uniref:Uncharacterized protein n=1 Tax=Aspergillus japonicus CBS 114.51 TaxID=1448312 RepID=A0A8T8XFS4_ASPJA|nr:hypothetical protein BO86DRAFT_80109 [Aspergillus japonicus CBS 114.51]RAH87183.1 hypothetical protein BO86DRAFT_80109 [Aspergillus japonicus CBS 114.51]
MLSTLYGTYISFPFLPLSFSSLCCLPYFGDALFYNYFSRWSVTIRGVINYDPLSYYVHACL